MLSLLSTVAHCIDVVLLQPFSFIIEAILAAIYYFFAGSCFVGYCLVQIGAHIWRALCNCYEVATVIFKECSIFYCDLRTTVENISYYIYDGTGDALSLAHSVAQSIFLFLANVLIGIGNFALWILLLLPRFIITLLDYLMLGVDHLYDYIVEHGKHLLNNLFRLSIGIALLLLLYMFRRYVYLFLDQLFWDIFTKLRQAFQCASIWTNQQLCWLEHKLQIGESATNRSSCVVCLERNKTIVILPCRHLCLCKDCSLQLHRFEGGRRCPVCRQSVNTLMTVYD